MVWTDPFWRMFPKPAKCLLVFISPLWWVISCAWKPENTKGIQAKRNAIPNFYISFSSVLSVIHHFKLYDFVKVVTDERLCAPRTPYSTPNGPLNASRMCVDVRRFAYFIRNKNKFIFDLCNWLSSFAAVVLFHFQFFFSFDSSLSTCVVRTKSAVKQPPTSEVQASWKHGRQ